jgi:hypothetical protein
MKSSATRTGTAAIVVLGFSAAVVLHAANGWWLNSRQRALPMMVALLLLALLTALWRPARPWASAAALWTGAFAAMAIILFSIGPGTIWPLVLAAAAIISGAAVCIGATIAAAAARLRR